MSNSNSRLTQTVRISLLAAHVATGLALSAVVYPLVSEGFRSACFRWWSRRLLRIIRVRVTAAGDAGATRAALPTLVVSNHVSWLDIFVIRSFVECRFVAKSEIRSWPLVGWLVARQGTVFVHRARRHDTSRVNATLERVLERGECMVVFPEGTTTDGTELRPFHGSLLQPLIHVRGFALPVALRYVTEDGRPDDKAAYAGDRSLWESTMLLTSQRETRVELTFLEPVQAVGRHRRDLAQHCTRVVAEALSLPVPGRQSGTPSRLPDAMR
ncbi:MAG: 1-acyl-sn-glycerol-3-phosphate acyltransferase [Betaproteobacteria bacterium]|nr:1-acyl-sn-glycerol-3-phosphate acyltransferase [Betaproteobacteria bacterium]